MRDYITSNSMRLMEKSVEFLWTKQAAHMDNISNAETPGYKVKPVTFEEEFRNRLRIARHRQAGKVDTRKLIEDSHWTVWEDEEDTRMDGNGVNVTEQMLEMVRSAYQMQYAYRALTSDITTLRNAITQ